MGPRCSRCKKKIKFKGEMVCAFTIGVDMHFDAYELTHDASDPPLYKAILCEKCYGKWSKKFDKFMNKCK